MCRISYIDECSAVWLEELIFARKNWRCLECKRTIPKGQIYMRCSSLYDGRWSKYQTCIHCQAAAFWLRYVCGGYVVEELLEELEEHWHEGYKSPGLARLIAGVRRGWNAGRTPIPKNVTLLAKADAQAMKEKIQAKAS